MLVLTRKPQEQIRIGNDIVITVLQFRGNAIRIGIEAPQNVRVMRGEISQKTTSQTVEVPLQMTNEAGEQLEVEVVEMTRNAKPRRSIDARKLQGYIKQIKDDSVRSSPLSRRIDARNKDLTLNRMLDKSSHKSEKATNDNELESEGERLDLKKLATSLFANEIIKHFANDNRVQFATRGELLGSK